MKNYNITLIGLLYLLTSLFMSCEDYLDIEPPAHKIVSKTVFENDETAIGAMIGIENQLASVHFSYGGGGSITVLASLSADELMPIYTTKIPYMEFEQHEIQPNNPHNASLWSSAYNMIYMTNSLIEGLSNSNGLSEEIRQRIEGQAKFVRAFTYFYLVNLYGEIPLITNTDYHANSLAAKNPEGQIYDQIITDLHDAMELIPVDFEGSERTNINRYTAMALMARVQLFLENWGQAESMSTGVILQNNYEILEDLKLVFLANSREAIWQISPEGKGSPLTNTSEGGTFIIRPIFYFLAQFQLEPSFVSSFQPEDKRLSEWIELHVGTGYYFPHKYKVYSSTEEVTEYSMVLRLAEQYLIRAEARARQGNLSGAIEDLDVIRGRAGLDLIAETLPEIEQEELLNLIMKERKKELFTEWGHRWLDLKRTGRAGTIFGVEESWQQTDLFYPIPESERMKNPNL